MLNGKEFVRTFLRGVSLATLALLLAFGTRIGAADAHAASTINVKIVGKARYGAAKLMIEEINSLRKKNGIPALTLDADLQEWATQMSAEMLFYPSMETSFIRPDGSSVDDSLYTKYVEECPMKTNTVTTSGSDEGCKDILSKMYKSYYSYILTDDFYKSIGIGLYQEKYNGYGRIYPVILLGSDNVNQGSFKSTVETEVRTIRTLPSNFKLSNGGGVEVLAGRAGDKLELSGNETLKTTIFQRTSDTNNVQLDSRQATYKIKDPTIASLSISENGIKVTGLKEGHTTFTATLHGQTVTYDVTVKGASSDTVQKPAVSSLNDLPKDYQGPAIVGGKEVYVKNRKRVTGNVSIGGVTYYYKNGVKYTGWLKKSGKKYYYSKGKPVRNKFKIIKNKKYYFNKKGVMQKGQVKVKGKYYYFNKSSVMQKNKWVKIGKYKYYFNKSGVRTKKKKRLK